MTTTEVAEALGIDRSRVLRYIKSGKLKAKQNGFKWDITPEEVERFKAIPRKAGWQTGRKRTQRGE